MTGPIGLRHGLAYDVDTGRIGVGHVSDPVGGRPVEVELTVAPYRGDEQDLTLHVGDRFQVGSASWRLVRVDGAGGYDYVVWIAPADEVT